MFQEVKKDVEPKDDALPAKKEKPGNVASLVQRMNICGLPAGGFQPHPPPKTFKKSMEHLQFFHLHKLLLSILININYQFVSFNYQPVSFKDVQKTIEIQEPKLFNLSQTVLLDDPVLSSSRAEF